MINNIIENLKQISEKCQELYKKLQEFCNENYPDKYNKSYYEDEKDMLPPSLELFFYNLWMKFKNWTPIYNLRMIIQTIFRKNHISDNKIWDLYYYLAKDIIPILLNEKSTYIAKGDLDAFNKMIYAFEWAAYKDGSEQECKDFFIKYFGFDPYDNDEQNKYIMYEYTKPNEKGNFITFNENEIPSDAINISQHENYSNIELLNYAEELAQEGFELFGERYLDFNNVFSLTKTILSYLIAFKNANRVGYPNKYTEYDENCGLTKEEYDEGIKNGTIIGGGEKQWEEDLNEIILTLEEINSDDFKNNKNWTKYLNLFGKIFTCLWD